MTIKTTPYDELYSIAGDLDQITMNMEEWPNSPKIIINLLDKLARRLESIADKEQKCHGNCSPKSQRGNHS